MDDFRLSRAPFVAKGTRICSSVKMKFRRKKAKASAAVKWIPFWVALVNEFGRVAAALIGRL